MLSFLLSSAKTMKVANPSFNFARHKVTQPFFLYRAAEFAQELKQKTPQQWEREFALSHSLANINYQRIQEWSVDHHQKIAQPAIFFYQGDVYRALSAPSFSEEEVDWLHHRLAIVSGLYGIVHPWDGILPYRLEMGQKWRNHILSCEWANELSQYLASWAKTRIIVQLASQEYSHFFRWAPHQMVIQPIFEDWSRGAYRVVGVLAKRARGLMLKRATQEKWRTIKDIQNFCEDGYHFISESSTENSFIFRRKKIE